MKVDIIESDSERFLLDNTTERFDLTFLDPPFNQGKDYPSHNDKMTEEDYWNWMKKVCGRVLENTSDGGAIYFMQREKNAHFVLESLNHAGWCFQNLIIWRKKTSAVPSKRRFGKHYQIIAFATKGKTPRVFNKLRIDPPLLVTEKYKRENGMYVTDVWNDIRELTSGYFAGDEALRVKDGNRLHKQQSPVQLLTRIILCSTMVGDMVFDPFAGTGTTLVVAKQLQRHCIGIELDPTYYNVIKDRISKEMNCDSVLKYRKNYSFTENLDDIWPIKNELKKEEQFSLSLKG